uniref:putative nuclease HARBI1 n=1 Tax=Fragaria vesca subsp. vesca TaxID=101020 RepID=UPI0005CB2D52|nr:PREDICTED: putative nuclease HARBI1 [Fragaria vesca subsp. vesca]
MRVDEMVAMFLFILGHHKKNRVIKFDFLRSGEMISRCFNKVLNGVLRLSDNLLKSPEPVLNNSTDDRWKWFKNCLGALDGTYIRVNVPEKDKPRYHTRKNKIATNVLGVCSQDMKFIYVLPSWEGSAADSRVLRDAMSRTNGLRVPQGYYYLVDAGYTNGNGFLAPYRGQQYHLNEWREGHRPTTSAKFFNMKHFAARNVIERCFGLLKLRWAILRSPAFYPIKTQCKIILACCLLHNHVRNEMPIDLLEALLVQNVEEIEADPITVVEASPQWSNRRDTLATEMFNEWIENRLGGQQIG